MKIDKNKLVFLMAMLCLLLFIGGYTYLITGADDEPNLEINHLPLPELENGQKQYRSKLDALNDLKQVRETDAPSIYDEHLLDSAGVYDPELMAKKKKRLIDSIYKQDQVDYSRRRSDAMESGYGSPKTVQPIKDKVAAQPIDDKKAEVEAKELALEHQLFFASDPIENDALNSKNTDNAIYVSVEGTQTVRTNYRLRMRSIKKATIDGKQVPRNTPIYGFVSFKPNRTMITIEHIGHDPVYLTAHDLQDGSEGIYVVNTFRAEATNAVLDDVIGDINIPSVPHVSGITQVLRRNNRSVKVTLLDNYRLILKPKQ